MKHDNMNINTINKYLNVGITIINENDFKKMQVNNRNLWLQFLNREAYFTTLSTLFKEKI